LKLLLIKGKIPFKFGIEAMRPLDLFLFLPHTVEDAVRLWAATALAAVVILRSRSLKCPAEENANCGKSPHTSARKNCEKTDIRTNKQPVHGPCVFEKQSETGNSKTGELVSKPGWF
jgi:hypothetical protein